MNKLASCFAGVALTALALSGCAASSAAGAGGSAPESAVHVGIETGRVLPSNVTGVPHDAVDLNEEGVWERHYAPLGTATAAIEEQFPDEFAYAFFDDSAAMHVAFAGPAPSEAVALLQNTGLPFVVVEFVGFNNAEYLAAADLVAEQTLQYVTDERQVSVSPKPTIEPGTIKVSFLSTDPELTTDPGLTAPPAGSRYTPVTVDAPFTVTFDDTYTSPVVMGIGTEKVGPSVEEQLALAPGEKWGPVNADTGSDTVAPSVDKTAQAEHR
jgi:hypothetical protein